MVRRRPSVATFHVMRDSIHHRKRVLGGMWGGMGGAIPDIERRIDAWGGYEQWGDSDQFMSEEIWPLMADRCLCHDSWGHFGAIAPFPPHAPLDGTSYVGEIVPVDRTGFDVWREVGVLQDRVVCYEAEIARLRDEVQRQQTKRDAIARARAVADRAGGHPIWRRMRRLVERRS